jgi:hypothetical protein
MGPRFAFERRNWTGSIPLSLMSLYFADLQVFDVFFCGSGILAFYRKIISDILSGIRVQACPTASGSHSSAERRRE